MLMKNSDVEIYETPIIDKINSFYSLNSYYHQVMTFLKITQITIF